MKISNTYKDYCQGYGIKTRLRTYLRDNVVSLLGRKKDINDSPNGIIFPYYHHVFDDEAEGFRRQLIHLKSFGDFISIDEASELLNKGENINERLFCVSFDDGFENCYTNMLPVTKEMNIPIIIYLATDYINLNINDAEHQKKIINFDQSVKKLVPFLSWKECKAMLNHNVTFGAHTHSHVNLSTLTTKEIEHELSLSKERIEKNLNIDCVHFAVPWGRPNIDFNPITTYDIATKVGFKTIATTERGINKFKSPLSLIKRDHILANWDNNQLNYFFSQQ